MKPEGGFMKLEGEALPGALGQEKLGSALIGKIIGSSSGAQLKDF